MAKENKKIKNKILVIGDVMVDSYIEGDVKRINPEAPIPILEANSSIMSLGGAANVAKNLTSFDIETYLIGYIGNDSTGQEFIKMAEKGNINIKLLKCSRTTLKQRYGYPQMLRVDWEEKVKNKKEDIDKIINFIKKIKPSVIIISDYAKGCISQPLFDEIIKLNKTMDFKIIVDPKPKNKVDYSGCFLMTPNLKEAVELFPADKLSETGIGLMKKNKCNVLITRSEEGMDLFTPNGCFHSPSTAKEICNVSGAGDAVVASLAFTISKGWKLDNAINFANKIAGDVVSLKSTSIQKNEKIVLTNGCFDIIHSGHIDYLKKASKLGYLIVGLNSDKSMERIKRKPQFNQDERKNILEALQFIDKVIIFDEDTPIKLIEEIKPDIYVKSKGYKNINSIHESIRELVRGKLCIIPMSINRSSSDIIRNIQNG